MFASPPKTPKSKVRDLQTEPKPQNLRDVEDESDNDDDDSLDRLSGTKKLRSLSALEDEEERRQDLLYAQMAQLKERSKMDNQSFLLQHSYRAPSKSFSSSNTFERQEQLSLSSEDVDTVKRQEKIRAILALEDAKYKEERKRKKMGVYADATNIEEFKRKEEEERIRIQKGKIRLIFLNRPPFRYQNRILILYAFKLYTKNKIHIM